MKPNQFLGIIKFFRNEEFLDKLVNGCFHCTPPEVYRLDEQKGVSDKFESCGFSYRKSRSDPEIILHINDRRITDHTSLTVHNAQNKDAWLHCWFTLRLPANEEGLAQLKSDIARMKDEFGHHFAFVPAPSINNLICRLQQVSLKSVSYGEVRYNSNNSEWGSLCKAIEYSYQREFRFLVGECNANETRFHEFNDPASFDGLILKNAEIKIKSLDEQVVWFEL